MSTSSPASRLTSARLLSSTLGQPVSGLGGEDLVQVGVRASQFWRQVLNDFHRYIRTKAQAGVVQAVIVALLLAGAALIGLDRALFTFRFLLRLEQAVLSRKVIDLFLQAVELPCSRGGLPRGGRVPMPANLCRSALRCLWSSGLVESRVTSSRAV